MTRRLWVDASVVRKPKAFWDLTALAWDCGVEVVVHPQVHLELCRHLRSKHGADYDVSRIASYLDQQHVTIAAIHFDREIAEQWAQRLHQRYDSTGAWEEASAPLLVENCVATSCMNQARCR